MKTGSAVLLHILTDAGSQEIQCTGSHRSPVYQQNASAKPVIDICRRERGGPCQLCGCWEMKEGSREVQDSEAVLYVGEAWRP